MGSSLPLSVPHALRRDGERLFDLSMWCLGRDVLHPENLLLSRGLSRERLPAGQKGTSAYRTAPGEGGALTLWGFGVVCREGATSVYVPRSRFEPLLVDEARLARPLFNAMDLGLPRLPTTDGERACARAALVTLARWLAGHEEWIDARLGPGWRRECLAAMKKAPVWPGEGLAAPWRRWAARVEALERSVVDTSWAPLAGV
ncbi:hypothetical protein [Archangium primigenium]|uniref:hypothetical protein n=1 Tax=[Archangium] primigenium TaxID=2792470 RepID=UPI00195A7A79|nr:hypothetical protein [Archangium primigenium]MBM7115248.1 hypothetical protein [Archangium primigenium]